MMVVPFLYALTSVTLLIPKLNGSMPSVLSHLLVDSDPDKIYSGVSKSGTAPQPIKIEIRAQRFESDSRDERSFIVTWYPFS